METKVSVVKNLQGSGTWQGKTDLFYRYDLEMENGDLGSYLSKTVEKDDLPFGVGDEIEYDFYPDDKYPKIKKPGKPGERYDPSKSKGGGGRDNYWEKWKPEFDQKCQDYRESHDKQRERSITIHGSLERAIHFHSVAGFESKTLEEQKVEVWETAKSFADNISNY